MTDYLNTGLHPHDEHLAKAVRRLSLNHPRPTSEHVAEARRIVHLGLRHELIQLAAADRKREVERQWANSALSLDELVQNWALLTQPKSWTTYCPKNGKVRHRTQSAVLELLGVMQRSGRGQGEVHVYFCRVCDAWHHGRAKTRRTGPMTISLGEDEQAS